MSRPMTSSVSALSSVVANGHQAMHDVSFSPSEIPYGGFSPVRLQIGIQPRPSLLAHTRQRLIRGQKSARPSHASGPHRGRSPLCVGVGETALRTLPIQRPLAHQRVVLSRRVTAYYGLIRDSRSLPPTYSFRRRVFALRLRSGGSLLYSACPSARAVCRTPADRVVMAGSSSTRGSLHPSVTGSASAVPRKNRFTRGCLTRLHSSLDAAARTVASPAPIQDVYFRAFIP